MKFNVSIDFETPRWLTKVVAIAAPVIVIVGVTAVVAATPHDFTNPMHQPLLGTDLNSLNRATNGGVSYSTGATMYCGSTNPAAPTGNLAGYVGAKGLCQAITATACGATPEQRATAHMCSSEELIRSMQLGVALMPSTGGWYSTGVNAAFPPGAGNTSDCAAWTATGGVNGAVWNSGGPSYADCGSSHPVLCCN